MARTASLSDVEDEEDDRRLRPAVAVAVEEEEEEHLTSTTLVRLAAEVEEVAKRMRCLNGCELTFNASISAFRLSLFLFSLLYYKFYPLQRSPGFLVDGRRPFFRWLGFSFPLSLSTFTKTGLMS